VDQTTITTFTFVAVFTVFVKAIVKSHGIIEHHELGSTNAATGVYVIRN